MSSASYDLLNTYSRQDSSSSSKKSSHSNQSHSDTAPTQGGTLHDNYQSPGSGHTHTNTDTSIHYNKY